MSTYYITDDTGITKLTSCNMGGGGSYSDIKCISLDDYEKTKLNIGDTVIYDLRLALDKATSTINNNKVWEHISSNNPDESDNQDETNNQDESGEESNISLIIYAVNELLSASWKKIILKKDDFPDFPNFSYLTFDGPDEGILKFYNKTISMEITGFENLSEIGRGCVQNILRLDISDNGLINIDIDNMFLNVRSITMRNMNPTYMIISEPLLEYLDMTNTISNSLHLSAPKLKTLIGFTPDTLITVEDEKGNEILPSLSLMDFKMPINLENFPSFYALVLANNYYFPTGLDTKNITHLDIINCKNNNKIRNFCIDNCIKINLSNILSLNSVKINNIIKYEVDGKNRNGITMIGNIDLMSLELPQYDFTDIAVILYANINLSEIIYGGISYGKEDSDKDLVALCIKSRMKLWKYDSNNTTNTDDINNTLNSKHKLGFNKLYIKEKFDYYNITPQIYKNSKLLGNPLTDSVKIENIIKNNYLQYYYIQLPNPIPSGITDLISFPTRLAQNVIDYNNNNIEITAVYSDPFIALNLNLDTDNIESLVEILNKNESGCFVFTDKPNLLKGVKNHIIINPFNYAPDLPNVFGIKLVVY